MKDKEEAFRKSVDFSTTARRQMIDWSGLPCEGAPLGKETGTRQGILPVVVDGFRRPPHIVLSGAFLALGAPECNGWPRRWASGQRRDWDPGRNCRIPA